MVTIKYTTFFFFIAIQNIANRRIYSTLTIIKQD